MERKRASYKHSTKLGKVGMKAFITWALDGDGQRHTSATLTLRELLVSIELEGGWALARVWSLDKTFLSSSAIGSNTVCRPSSPCPGRLTYCAVRETKQNKAKLYQNIRKPDRICVWYLPKRFLEAPALLFPLNFYFLNASFWLCQGQH